MSYQSIAYLGIPGSYSYFAAKAFFLDAVSLVGADSFRLVFDAVKSQNVQAGIIPIENTLAGSIYENYDLLQDSGLNIIGEHYLRIDHNLLVCGATTNINTIKKVYSHQKALEQCEKFFKKYPTIEKIAVGDTASAARFVKKAQNLEYAAISSPQAGELYGLTVIEDHISDKQTNYTRFLAVSREPGPEDANKCSLVAHLPHTPGSLYKILGILKTHNCNLTKIESRPTGGKLFEYAFYFDFLYKPQEQPISSILKALGEAAAQVQALGLYKENQLFRKEMSGSL